MKTNPAYAALAYRKTIIHHLVYHLQRDCLGEDGISAKEPLVSEDVFAIDSEVPKEEIEAYLEELVDQEEEIKVQMGKFEFTRKDYGEQRKEKPKQERNGKARKNKGHQK